MLTDKMTDNLRKINQGEFEIKLLLPISIIKLLIINLF